MLAMAWKIYCDFTADIHKQNPKFYHHLSFEESEINNQDFIHSSGIDDRPSID